MLAIDRDKKKEGTPEDELHLYQKSCTINPNGFINYI